MSELISGVSVADLRDMCMDYDPAQHYCLTDGRDQHTSLCNTPSDHFTEADMKTALGLLRAHKGLRGLQDVPTPNDVYFETSPASVLVDYLQSRRSQILSSTAAVKKATKYTSAADDGELQTFLGRTTDLFNRLHVVGSEETEKILDDFSSSALDKLSQGTGTHIAMTQLVRDMIELSPHNNPYPGYGHRDEESIDSSRLLDHELAKNSVFSNAAARSNGEVYWHMHKSEAESDETL